MAVNYFEQLYCFGTMPINDYKLKSIINCLIHNFRIEYSLRKLEKFTFCNWRLCCILKMNCHNLLAKLFWVWAIIILKTVIYTLQSCSVLSNHIKFFNIYNSLLYIVIVHGFFLFVKLNPWYFVVLEVDVEEFSYDQKKLFDSSLGPLIYNH